MFSGMKEILSSLFSGRTAVPDEKKVSEQKQEQSPRLSGDFVIRMAARLPSADKITMTSNALDHASNVRYDELHKRYENVNSHADDKDFKETKGLVVNTLVSENKFTLLNAAVVSNDLQYMKWLVEAQGANVNLGVYPSLCLAAAAGHLELAEYLISQGADVNRPMGRHLGNLKELGGKAILHETPIHIAVLNHRVAMVRLLLEHNAQMSVVYHRTPIELAQDLLAKNDHHWMQAILKLLLDHQNKQTSVVQADESEVLETESGVAVEVEGESQPVLKL